ncbi:MAG: hypothetical protein CCU26_18890 [Nitrospira sp. UW-LDO-01]|nr:MAG: hypothetical protein CCU26_18890 [Nitrospira sp. UW-LDO-01]
MQDTALYQYLLGLESPWTVSRVNLEVAGQRVDVWAEHPEDATWTCPHCAETLPLYDHAEERTWRHFVSADAISPTITELRSSLNTESQCLFTAHHDGGGTDAAKGGLHDDSGIGSTWALSL